MTSDQHPDNYNASKYPSSFAAVDLVIFTIRDGRLCVLLVERGDEPFKGSLALPGGFIDPDEDAETAAWRELAEETGMSPWAQHPADLARELFAADHPAVLAVPDHLAPAAGRLLADAGLTVRDGTQVTDPQELLHVVRGSRSRGEVVLVSPNTTADLKPTWPVTHLPADDTVFHLEQLHTYTAPRRDPRHRIISVAHVAIAPDLPDPAPGSDAADARWEPVNQLLAEENGGAAPDLAFDHADIVRDAVERVRAKLEYTTLATRFVPDLFPKSALRGVYEVVWNVTVDKSNFNRKLDQTEGFLEATGRTGVPSTRGGRPPALFRAGAATSLHPPILRPGN